MEHTFTMNLTPDGSSSCVLLDGDDISSLLRGIRVEAGVGESTLIELLPARGKRAVLIARLPEAHITIGLEPTSSHEYGK
jgi:hypothetical protein